MEKYIVTQDKAIVNMRNVQRIEKVRTAKYFGLSLSFSSENDDSMSTIILEVYDSISEADAEFKRIIEWLATKEPVYTMTAGESGV